MRTPPAPLHRCTGNSDVNPRIVPAHGERHAVPLRRQARREGNGVAAQVEAGEAKHDRLPHTAQSRDPDATRAVRVQFKIRGRRLPQMTERGCGFAEPRYDQRVKTRAERTAVGAAWIVAIAIAAGLGNSSGSSERRH